MNQKIFFQIFRESFKDLIKNPLIIFPGFFLWLFLTLFSKISVSVNQGFTNTIHLSLWLSFFGLVSVIFMSFIFAGLIRVSQEIILTKKTKIQNFFSGGKKFFFGSVIVTLAIIIIGIIIQRTAHFIALQIGKVFQLNLLPALFIFLVIYFIGLISGLIWLTFANVKLVVENKNAFMAIKSSANLVKKEYLATLSLSVIFFVFFWLTRKFNGIIPELIEYILIIPFLALVLTRFVLASEKLKK